MTDHSNRPTILSEELAHRVLARAVELDVLQRSGTTVERLREVSRELGIADDVLDAALAETRLAAPAAPRSTVGRWLDRLRGTTPKQSLSEQVLANLAAGVSFWALLSVLDVAASGLSDTWQVSQGLTLTATIVSVFVALRLRARPLTYVLGTAAVAQVAEYVMHLAYGISAVQGAPTHFAILLASAMGVGATWLGSRMQQRREAQEPVTAELASDETTSSWSLLRAPLRPALPLTPVAR